MDPTKLTTWTYAEYFAEARSLAAALVGLGFQERDTVCIFGFNAPEWHMSALAAVMAHGSFSGIYPSDTPQQIQWKALLTNASVAFVDSNSGADRFIKIVDQLPYLKAVVHWGDDFDKTKGPISRVDGTVFDIFLPIVSMFDYGAVSEKGWEVTMARPYDLKAGSLKDRLVLTRPTIFLGVPRAAPLKMATLRYFASINIQINELYGMSECTGTTTMSTPLTHTWGSVGFPLPGVEIKIFKPSSEAGSTSDAAEKVECPRAQDLFRPQPAEEGEICFRGRHIMLGYLANPSLGEDHVLEMRRKNREAIDNEGWLHSGDKGCIDTSGMLRVTGRYKELIIGAGGENIAPVPIEDAILEACPAISNVIMIGDKRKFNVALVTLKSEGATGELPGSDDLAGPALDLVDGITKVSEAIASEAFAEKVTDVLVAVNKNGKVVPSNAAKIQKFMILRQDFSITTGELTATLKLKRSVVEDMYKVLIDSMYESGETYVQCPP
ncbi:Long-chain-fatty-acid--CoA ligase ACSBG2 [Hondaea fermentalgiana]|uniref:Long-chain-fatty-acid--CoA ligase ACSBG2 n=1 Tax=Hondaea fermentalgiana TaxID=2315210 RepID=A0A2R5G892_9STRA|nr:Long-chain-fatty-acid--CoA ligase ACSBG2 [Hondaea fermentalgiana]|eukprot:GBG24261.1 Long-chain-fatty-acid--CoA ligase ACSBG2 [Hondaea fermentalgiana]